MNQTNHLWKAQSKSYQSTNHNQNVLKFYYWKKKEFYTVFRLQTFLFLLCQFYFFTSVFSFLFSFFFLYHWYFFKSIWKTTLFTLLSGFLTHRYCFPCDWKALKYRRILIQNELNQFLRTNFLCTESKFKLEVRLKVSLFFDTSSEHTTCIRCTKDDHMIFRTSQKRHM